MDFALFIVFIMFPVASVNKNGAEEVKGCSLKVVRDHSSGSVLVQVAFFGKGKKQLLKSVCLSLSIDVHVF